VIGANIAQVDAAYGIADVGDAWEEELLAGGSLGILVGGIQLIFLAVFQFIVLKKMTTVRMDLFIRVIEFSEEHRVLLI